MDNVQDKYIKDNEKTNENKPDLVTFVLLKGEKIVAAVYAVTAFLSDSEPLKWKLRESSLDLLSELSFLRQSGGSYRSSMLDRVTGYLRSLIALFDVGLASGFVSEMNFRILRNECVNLIEKIKDLSSASSLESSLRVEMPLLVAAAPVAAPETLSYTTQGQSIKDRKSFNQSAQHNVQNNGQIRAGGSSKITTHRNNARRDSIIKFVRGKGWIAIKDIAAAVPGCSVKTVQRELAALVSEGVLKKQGDRRWSRYILA
jgi:hypothetical protein